MHCLYLSMLPVSVWFNCVVQLCDILHPVHNEFYYSESVVLKGSVSRFAVAHMVLLHSCMQQRCDQFVGTVRGYLSG